jgi:hypothetical protein
MAESLQIMLADPGVDIGIVWLAFTKDADVTRTFIETKARGKPPSWPGRHS